MKNWDTIDADEVRILSRHFSKGRGGHRVEFIGVHHNAGNLSIADCYNVWQNREASAHYQVDGNGRIGQLVWDKDTAWALGNFNANQRSINIEHANNTGAAGGWTVSEPTLDNGAHLVAALCKFYKLGRPVWGKNVRPHSQISPTACPGAIGGAQRDHYMERAQYWYDQMTGSHPAPAPQPSPQPAPQPNNGHSGTGFGGTYTCMVDTLNVRTAPSIYAQAVATYHKGQTVVLDDWYKNADGYIWGKYTGGSGNIRYIAVGKATGKVSNDDFLIKDGKVSVQTVNLGDKNYWGPAYTKALQAALGTTQDGIISSQPAANRKYIGCADTHSWEFVNSGAKGSKLIAALQKRVGSTADGLFGKNSAMAIQKYLVAHGYNVGSAGCDGYFGNNSCIALGKAIEANLF